MSGCVCVCVIATSIPQCIKSCNLLLGYRTIIVCPEQLVIDDIYDIHAVSYMLHAHCQHTKTLEIQWNRNDSVNWPIFFVLSRSVCVLFADPMQLYYITQEFSYLFRALLQNVSTIAFRKSDNNDSKVWVRWNRVLAHSSASPHNPTQVHICLIHIPHERDFCSMRNSMGVFVRVCVFPPQSISIANESIYTMPVWIYLMFVQRLTLCAAYASQVEINFQWLNLTVPNFAQMFAAWIGFGFGFGHSTWYYATSVLCGNVC